jgi:hypothetical protein
MMYPYGDARGAGGWILMTFILLVVLGLLIAAAVAVIRGPNRFFHAAGLDYVSCSPFRVPVARLEAGRAALPGHGDRSDSR